MKDVSPSKDLSTNTRRLTSLRYPQDSHLRMFIINVILSDEVATFYILTTVLNSITTYLY